MLYQRLALEAAFQPRTPKLLLTLKHKAIRILGEYDTTNLTPAAYRKMITDSVVMAYYGSSEEKKYARMLDDSWLRRRVARLNKYLA